MKKPTLTLHLFMRMSSVQTKPPRRFRHGKLKKISITYQKTTKLKQRLLCSHLFNIK
nr:MAG TPA: hypothetical protein [Caudoviricetes sp.]